MRLRASRRSAAHSPLQDRQETTPTTGWREMQPCLASDLSAKSPGTSRRHSRLEQSACCPLTYVYPCSSVSHKTTPKRRDTSEDGTLRCLPCDSDQPSIEIKGRPHRTPLFCTSLQRLWTSDDMTSSPYWPFAVASPHAVRLRCLDPGTVGCVFGGSRSSTRRSIMRCEPSAALDLRRLLRMASRRDLQRAAIQTSLPTWRGDWPAPRTLQEQCAASRPIRCASPIALVDHGGAFWRATMKASSSARGTADDPCRQAACVLRGPSGCRSVDRADAPRETSPPRCLSSKLPR